MNCVRHLELFSGIGGFRHAFECLALDYGFNSVCTGFSEIDRPASIVYKANYNTKKTRELGDITAFTESYDNISSLEDFDILTGGFPCQSFSMMGSQKGFEDKRGNLFFNIIRILQIKKPKFVLLENVRNLVTHNSGETFKTIKTKLEDLGYSVYYDIFDSERFDLAQRRNRVYIFCILKPFDIDLDFSADNIQSHYQKAQKKSLLIQRNIHDVLYKNADSKYYLSDKIKPTILSNGTAGFKSKSDINQIIARPLTATMVKMHRACQDNYYSDDFIASDVEYPTEILEDKHTLSSKRIRKLMPEEAFMLQGFPAKMVENARKAGVSDHQLYKQAGNAASVNVIYAILYYLIIVSDIMKWK